MQILFVDDEPLGREVIAEHLESQLGHNVTQCDTGEQALGLFEQNLYPMVLTDIKMPGINGIELLIKLKELPEGKATDVVLLTAYGDLSTAIAALRAGAYDYLNKPVELHELAAVVNRIVEHQALKKENYELTHHFKEKVEEATRETNSKLEQLRNSYAEIAGVGEVGFFSRVMRDVMTMAGKLREDQSVPVLIEGETGTGKEIIARLIHYGEKDCTDPFIAINCSTISPNLVESELFGYEGGAFTGAKKAGQLGKFELAQRGTIFLDEIGDMPLELQPKLLRVLQERDFYRVGGLKRIQQEARVICASNQNLKSMVDKGAFREDLFYRLNVGRVYIPPLRQRREEILPLALMFMEKFARRRKRRFKSIHPESVRILEEYSWPGNVRELQNILERVILLHDGTEILPDYLRFLFAEDHDDSYSQGPLDDTRDSIVIALPPGNLDLEAIEAGVIRKVLAKFDGNKTRAAAYLGISRPTLRNKIK